MSLLLAKSNPPKEVFTLPSPINGERVITFRDVDIPMSDFVELVMYVMCNTQLMSDDARLKLLEEFQTLVPKETDQGHRLVGQGPLGEHFSYWP